MTNNTTPTREAAPKRLYRPQRKRQPYGPPPPYRRQRGNVRQLKLQPRDVELLAAVALYRVLTQDLFVWLFPADPNQLPPQLLKNNLDHGKRTGTNIGRRLAKLYHEGFLARIRTVYGGPLIYALDDDGAKLLRDLLVPIANDPTADPRPDLIPETSPLRDQAAAIVTFIQAANWREKNRDLSQQYINHALMLARFRAALTVASRASSWQLEQFTRDGKSLLVKWSTQRGDRKLQPDAFVILTNGKHRLAFCVEVDQSTMHSDRMASKFATYAAMAGARMHKTHFDVDAFRVLVVTKSPQRADNLAALIAGSYQPPRTKRPLPSPVHFKQRDLFLTVSESEYTARPENIFAKLWRFGPDPAKHVAVIPQPLPLTDK